jgi:predicted ABC-class ATPase
MSDKVFLISPEAPPHQFAGAGEQRAIKTGAGIRLGTLDNTKGNADHLLAFVVEGIRKLVPVASVISLRKNNPSTPAPKNVLDQLEAEADFVISAMAD